jgi:hypothetical protein
MLFLEMGGVGLHLERLLVDVSFKRNSVLMALLLQRQRSPVIFLLLT